MSVSRSIATTIYKKEHRSGIPPGLIGELYLNFGWTGTFLGAFVLGSTLGLAYKVFLLAMPLSHYGLAIYSYLMMHLAGGLLSFNFAAFVARVLIAMVFVALIFLIQVVLRSRADGRAEQQAHFSGEMENVGAGSPTEHPKSVAKKRQNGSMGKD